MKSKQTKHNPYSKLHTQTLLSQKIPVTRLELEVWKFDTQRKCAYQKLGFNECANTLKP